MSINTNNSNPLGSNFDTGTTGSTLGKVTTGGQNQNVQQEGKVDGTQGVALSEQDLISDTSTAKDIKLTVRAAEDPTKPHILPVRALNLANVQFAPGAGAAVVNKPNLWLTSFFLTALSVNFTKIAMLGKEMHKAEGVFTVLMLQKVWTMAVQTAALIMAKAQTEANMHMAMAIGAMVGLAVAVAGAALSLGGLGKTAKAKLDLKKAQADGPPVNSASQARGGANPGVGSQTARKPPKPLPHRPVGDRAGDVGQQPAQRAPRAQEGQPDRPVQQGTGRRADGTSSDNASFETLPDVVPEGPPVNPAPVQPVAQPVAGQPAQGGQPAQVNQPAGQGNQPAGQANQPAGQANQPAQANPTEAPKPKTPEEKYTEAKLAGKRMSVIGAAVTQAANPITQIIENLIQMVYKPIIGAFDAKIELKRAEKELAQKALDSSIQSFNGATEVVDGATRAYDKTSETIKANSINSRGG